MYVYIYISSQLLRSDTKVSPRRNSRKFLLEAKLLYVCIRLSRARDTFMDIIIEINLQGSLCQGQGASCYYLHCIQRKIKVRNTR